MPAKLLTKLYVIEYGKPRTTSTWQSLPAHIYVRKSEATYFINAMPITHRRHYRVVTFRRSTR